MFTGVTTRHNSYGKLKVVVTLGNVPFLPALLTFTGKGIGLIGELISFKYPSTEEETLNQCEFIHELAYQLSVLRLSNSVSITIW